MLAVTVILALILAGSSLDCIWLKNEQNAGKLTSLMESSSGPTRYHQKQKSIQLRLYESQNHSTRNLTLILDFEKRKVEQSIWINYDNLDLSVLFSSSKNVGPANQTKYLSFKLKANITFNLKQMLLIYTSQGSFIFNFPVQVIKVTQNPTPDIKPIKQKDGKFSFYFPKSQQPKLLYFLISVFIVGSDLYFWIYYWRLQTQFRLSKAMFTLYLFSQLIYFLEIIEKSPDGAIYIIIFCLIGLIVLGKLSLLVTSYILSWETLTFRDFIEDTIILVICITFSYSLYFLMLVYCIIRDTQRHAQMKFTSHQRLVSHCYTLSVIMYIPVFKILFNTPQGFSQSFWWTYLFMLVYLCSMYEICYQGGVSVFSRKLRDYWRILKNRDVKNASNQQIRIKEQVSLELSEKSIQIDQSSELISSEEPQQKKERK